mgnify:CR=1 FL=1
MFAKLKQLVLGLGLIAAASALLLYSDLGSRAQQGRPRAAEAQALKVAVVQHASDRKSTRLNSSHRT